MELDKIIPLQETPKTPYQTSIAVPILRFRWIHAQCFQFELPGGKENVRVVIPGRVLNEMSKVLGDTDEYCTLVFDHRLLTQMNLER